MSWPGWLAMICSAMILLLPRALPARAGALAAGGRLARIPRARVPGARAISRRRSDGSASSSSVLSVRSMLTVMCGIAGFGTIGITAGWLLAVPAGAAFATVALLVRDRLRSARTAARQTQVRAALAVLIGELEAGAQPSAALAAAAAAGAAVADVFARAAEAARRTGDAGAVLAADGDSNTYSNIRGHVRGDVDGGVRLVGLAWQLGDSTGAAFAGVLTRVAVDLAAADEQRRTVSVTLAGPRASAALLSGLPLLGIALGAAMGARPVPLLLHTAAGQALCCVGVLLDAAGLLWIRRILQRAVRA